MSDRSLLLFDDVVAREWAPFSLTRPVGELLLGSLTLRARTEAVLAAQCIGHWSHPGLEGFMEPGAAPVLTEWPQLSGAPILLFSSRVALAWEQDPLPEHPTRFTVGGTTVGWALTPDRLPPAEALVAAEADGLQRSPESTAWENSIADLPVIELKGEVLDRPWDLMAANAAWLLRDGEQLWTEDFTPDGVLRIGEHPLSLAPGAVVEPGVMVDTRMGPVRLESEARACAPARLVGPLHMGRGSTVLGGPVGSSTLGPVCKIRGEVADSVILAFSNKAHDGHLGHAVLGRWVNLGAGTTNSDLKNNYGPVRVWTPSGTADTGLTKVGCFLGDHVKTGIGTLLTTGAVIGAGANLFGGSLTPAVVPPFAWGQGPGFDEYRLDAFLQVAERTMGRRDQTLGPGLRALLRRAWESSKARRET